jgi:adenylyltransferase/sulfurtransferase
MEEIAPADLQARLAGEGTFVLLDVRNIQEYQLCHLPGSLLIPLPELGERLHDLDSSKEIIVYCKSGARSRSAAQLLNSQGFTHVKHLTGGILAWIAEIDPSMQHY